MRFPIAQFTSIEFGQTQGYLIVLRIKAGGSIPGQDAGCSIKQKAALPDG